MEAPVCSVCARPQGGIVCFLWSEGDVVYECRHCGFFNEVVEIPVRRWRPRKVAPEAATTAQVSVAPAAR